MIGPGFNVNSTLCLPPQVKRAVLPGKTSLKQYIPSKPKEWGYKFFVLADDKVMYDFIPYTGKISGVDDNDVLDLKAGSNIALHLHGLVHYITT